MSLVILYFFILNNVSITQKYYTELSHFAKNIESKSILNNQLYLINDNYGEQYILKFDDNLNINELVFIDKEQYVWNYEIFALNIIKSKMNLIGITKEKTINFKEENKYEYNDGYFINYYQSEVKKYLTDIPKYLENFQIELEFEWVYVIKKHKYIYIMGNVMGKKYETTKYSQLCKTLSIRKICSSVVFKNFKGEIIDKCEFVSDDFYCIDNFILKIYENGNKIYIKQFGHLFGEKMYNVKLYNNKIYITGVIMLENSYKVPFLTVIDD